MSAIQNLSPGLITPTDSEITVIERRNRDLDDDAKPEPRLVYIGDYSGKTAYYSPFDDDIMLGEMYDGEFTEEGYLEAPDTSGLADHILEFVKLATEEDVDFELSKQAYAIAYAEVIGQRGLLPTGQAKVYLLRDLFDVSRQQTAQLLGIAPSTVDTQLREAREKIEIVRQLDVELTKLAELSSVVG